MVKDAPLGPVAAVEVVPQQNHLLIRFRLRQGADIESAAYRDRDTPHLLLALTGTVPPGDEAMPPLQAARPPANPGRWTLDTIVIDAGHGGKDAGATAHGVREKDVTLSVAKRVGRLVENELGVRVVFTRSDDRFIELRERGRMANTAGAKLFVSIHANAARNGTAGGTETFFLGLHKSDAARSVMERENSVVALEDDPSRYADFDEQQLIVQTLAQSAYLHKSEQLAGLIEQEFEQEAGRSSRGVKQAGFYVLWSASMPAILVELGFVTNRKEAAFLASRDGQDVLARAIFRAIRAFKDEYERDLGLVGAR